MKRSRILAVAATTVTAVALGASPAHAIAIDGYRFDAYTPLTTPCSGGDQGGMTRMIAWMRENSAWAPTLVQSYACRTDAPSAHREGRAVDWFLDRADPAQLARANDLVYTLMADDAEGNVHSLARRMGVQEIIWNDLAWDARYGDAWWQDYTPGLPGNSCVGATGDAYVKRHCNHVHIGLNWAGARQETTFWNPAFTQRSDSTFYISGEGTSTAAGATVGRPIYGRPRDNALGLPGDKPIAGDWDGNRSTTIGIVRGHIWYLRDSASTGRANRVFGYGLDSDTPIVGDWNGDRIQTPGVVRIEGGQLRWYLRNSNTNGVADIAFSYGLPGDRPVVGDWNGDGRQTIGVIRAVGGAMWWYLRNSNTAGVADIAFGYGLASDRPVAGDWNNDGRDTQGVVRATGASSFCPAGGMQWLLSDTLAGGANRNFGYGCWSDRPVPGDWNASGTDTAGVGRRF